MLDGPDRLRMTKHGEKIHRWKGDVMPPCPVGCMDEEGRGTKKQTGSKEKEGSGQKGWGK